MWTYNLWNSNVLGFLWDKVSLCHYRFASRHDPPAPVSQVLILQARIIILSSHSVLCAHCKFFPYILIFSITVTLMMSEYYAEWIMKVIFSNILLFRLFPTSLQWTVLKRNICKHLVLFTWNKLLWAELFCQCAYKNVRLWGHNTKLPARM